MDRFADTERAGGSTAITQEFILAGHSVFELLWHEKVLIVPVVLYR